MCVLTDELKRAKTNMTNLEHENNKSLDVVNENDEIIDSKSRTDVHNLGLLHREIHVWMFDQDKNVLFQKIGLHRPSAGLLDATVGGHVNMGESYLDAAVRETEEETGLSILPSDLVLLKKFRQTSDPSKENFLGTINNFIRAIYIYKNPVDDKFIRKETGIPGVGFQKLSYDFLQNPGKDYIKMFDRFILNDEIPDVLKYIK
jgi:isopentenyldiphosphate isomerase